MSSGVTLRAPGPGSGPLSSWPRGMRSAHVIDDDVVQDKAIVTRCGAKLANDQPARLSTIVLLTATSGPVGVTMLETSLGDRASATSAGARGGGPPWSSACRTVQIRGRHHPEKSVRDTIAQRDAVRRLTSQRSTTSGRTLDESSWWPRSGTRSVGVAAPLPANISWLGLVAKVDPVGVSRPVQS